MTSPFGWALCLLLSVQEPSAAYPRAELLIEPQELLSQLDQYRVLDARTRAKYDAGHLPGAVWVDHDAWAKVFAAQQDPHPWAGLIGKLGINNQTRVAIYDDGSVKEAARIWWILRYWGVKEVRLVNGSWPGLTAAKAPLTDRTDTVKARTFAVREPARQRLADKASLLDIVNKKTAAQIIDTRSQKEFCGDTRMARRGGAIPGAIHLEWSDALDPQSRRFKSARELATLFKEAGIDLDKKSVTYCQSGGRAALMAFALELMGGHDVADYFRSWSEWGNDESTPIVTPRQK